jgi:hypothetical protein
MARIRTIKPSIWGDAGVARVSRDARLLMVGLITMADDSGRFLGSPAAVTGHVFPNDCIQPSRVQKWLSELAKEDLIHLYRIDGIAYGCFLKWKRHQKISHPQPSALPPPQEELFDDIPE